MKTSELFLSKIHELINQDPNFNLSIEQVKSVFLLAPEINGDVFNFLFLTEKKRHIALINTGIELCKESGISSIYADIAYAVISKCINERLTVKFRIKDINEVMAWDFLLYEDPCDNQIDHMTVMSSNLIALLHFGHPYGNHEFTSIGEFMNFISDIKIIDSLDLRKIPASLRLLENLEDIKTFITEDVNNYNLITSIIFADRGPLERLLRAKRE